MKGETVDLTERHEAMDEVRRLLCMVLAGSESAEVKGTLINALAFQWCMFSLEEAIAMFDNPDRAQIVDTIERFTAMRSAAPL